MTQLDSNVTRVEHEESIDALTRVNRLATDDLAKAVAKAAADQSEFCLNIQEAFAANKTKQES